MKTKFVKLTDATSQNLEPVYIRADFIVSVEKSAKHGGCRLILAMGGNIGVGGTYYYVKESYEDIIDKIDAVLSSNRG